MVVVLKSFVICEWWTQHREGCVFFCNNPSHFKNDTSNVCVDKSDCVINNVHPVMNKGWVLIKEWVNNFFFWFVYLFLFSMFNLAISGPEGINRM
jgi:hypothetical protein